MTTLDPRALTRPIIGIENRTAQEVFDIMSDRFLAALSQPQAGEPVAWMREVRMANPNLPHRVEITRDLRAVEDIWRHSEHTASLRPLYASPQPALAMKGLEWRSHGPDSFPEPAWSAQTPFGFYNLEEVSASDSPRYVVRLHGHHFVADKDSLEEAKAAAQADYETRIRSALVASPQPANPVQVTDAARAFMDLFVEDGADPPALTLEVDPNELANRYESLSIALANPARVTDVDLDYGLKLIAEAIESHFGDRDDAYKYEIGDTTIHDVWEAYDVLTTAIGAGGQAVAADIGDAVLAWMVKYDLLDGDNEYQVADVMAVMDDLVPSSALSQPHPADERVVEALRKAANIAFDEMFAVTGAPVARAVQQKILALSAKEGR